MYAEGGSSYGHTLVKQQNTRNKMAAISHLQVGRAFYDEEALHDATLVTFSQCIKRRQPGHPTAHVLAPPRRHPRG